MCDVEERRSDRGVSEMMKLPWKKLQSLDDLPKEGTNFLALWKGRICIGQYCKEDEAFFISFDPATYEGSWEVAPDRLKKFSHYILLDYPDAYPDDFVAMK